MESGRLGAARPPPSIPPIVDLSNCFNEAASTIMFRPPSQLERALHSRQLRRNQRRLARFEAPPLPAMLHNNDNHPPAPTTCKFQPSQNQLRVGLWNRQALLCPIIPSAICETPPTISHRQTFDHRLNLSVVFFPRKRGQFPIGAVRRPLESEAYERQLTTKKTKMIGGLKPIGKNSIPTRAASALATNFAGSNNTSLGTIDGRFFFNT